MRNPTIILTFQDSIRASAIKNSRRSTIASMNTFRPNRSNHLCLTARGLLLLLLSVGISFGVSAQDPENLILISAGTFTMGSDTRAADEKPMHKVYLNAYYISKYEVTNAEYHEFWKQQLKNRFRRTNAPTHPRKLYASPRDR